MIHETPIQRDLRSLARMLAEEKRRIPRPDSPPQWFVEDCKRHSALAHSDAVEAKQHYDAVSSGFLQRCAEVGGQQAHEELDEAKHDLDDARACLDRCWSICQHGLTDSWERLESGKFDRWIDEQNAELAEPDDQPAERVLKADKEQRRPEACKTDEVTPLVVVRQGILF